MWETFNNGLFWALVSILLWQIYILAFHRGVPNIGTAPAIRNKIIELLKRDSSERTKNPYTIIDLGSGDGKLTREIAREMPHSHVIGVELSYQSYLLSMFLKRLQGLQNLDYKRMNFFSFDTSVADAVVLYQSIFEMDKIGEKLHQELKKGTLVTSNKFQLQGWEPVESMDVKTLYLHQKKLHVYRR